MTTYDFQSKQLTEPAAVWTALTKSLNWIQQGSKGASVHETGNRATEHDIQIEQYDVNGCSRWLAI
jgi:hypothetical protein